MKDFMTKVTNVWKAWSTLTKSVVVVTLALLIFVASGILSTQPTPSPRFSVPDRIAKNIQDGGAYHILCQELSAPSAQADKAIVDFKYANPKQALLPASITKLETKYQFAALDIAFDRNLGILETYQVEDIHYKVMQLNKILYGVLSENDLKNHIIDGYLIRIQGKTVSILMSYGDKCAIGIDYDHSKDAYVGLDIKFKGNDQISYTEKQKILKYLNENLDKSNN